MTPPKGSRVDLDRSVRTFRDGTVLVGGHPGRVITLSPEGASALRSLLTDGTGTTATARLADRLVTSGMAHPRPADAPTRTAERSLTVVVPVHDRSDLLDRCLQSLGSAAPVVVVDDASHDPAAVAEVCRRHRARLLVRSSNGGPATARNDALATIDTELVAFVDSDCTVTEGWLERLAWLFDDPDIAAVAPRVRPQPSGPTLGRSALARFSGARSPLDLGPVPSEVGPDRLVRYVPSAALVVRRSALGEGFDAGLRVGEDVDLVWRLVAEGWRVRFQPDVEVFHREPTSWKGWLARRYRYGTSAGALSSRHPGRLAPVELRPWPTAAAIAASDRTASDRRGDGGCVDHRPGTECPPPRHSSLADHSLECGQRRMDGGRHGKSPHRPGRTGTRLDRPARTTGGNSGRRPPDHPAGHRVAAAPPPARSDPLVVGVGCRRRFLWGRSVGGMLSHRFLRSDDPDDPHPRRDRGGATGDTGCERNGVTMRESESAKQLAGPPAR